MTNEIYTIDGERLRLRLHKGQTKAWRSNRRFVFIIAGTQGGKTSFGPWWLYREIQRQGDGDYLVVTSTYDLFKLKLLPEVLAVFGRILPDWSYVKIDKTIYSPDRKTRIILRSADAEGGLESATAKAAWLDECGQDKFKVGAWEAVLRRLSLARGRVLGTTTPYNMGWLKTQIFDRWRKGDKDYQVVQFASTMNPAFPVEEYQAAKTRLPAWKFEMFYNGNFTRPAGMIYSDFDPDKHVIPAFDIPAEWPRLVGVDFGAVNTATVWLAEDTERACYYLYRDTLQGGMTTQEHTDIAKSHAKTERVTMWLGGAKSETQQRMDWASNGVPVGEPNISDVESGIDRVIALIKTGRLYVFDNCTGVIDEFGTYSRKLSEHGEPTEVIENKNDYHRLDALRYIASGITDRTWAIF